MASVSTASNPIQVPRRWAGRDTWIDAIKGAPFRIVGNQTIVRSHGDQTGHQLPDFPLGSQANVRLGRGEQENVAARTTLIAGASTRVSITPPSLAPRGARWREEVTTSGESFFRTDHARCSKE